MGFFSNLFGRSSNQPGEADPLVEADVYMAYGRTEQAISLLEEALKNNPQRTDIAEKLRSLKKK
ncbi:MAG: hypothetical protein FWG81_10300 [Betaproteobacteria bacterium]|nr:hypothetical protein [Betaproteobacteria bacterium]